MRYVRRRIAVIGAGLGGAVILGIGVLGMGVTAADAAPANAPSSLAGSFVCGSQTGTFVTNSGNASAPTTWNVAHLVYADGSTAIFQPRAFDLTFTLNGQTPTTEIATHNGPGSTVCSILAGVPGVFSLTGDVTGKVTPT